MTSTKRPYQTQLGPQLQMWPPLLLMALGLATGMAVVYADYFGQESYLEILTITACMLLACLAALGMMIRAKGWSGQGLIKLTFEALVVATCLILGMSVATYQRLQLADHGVISLDTSESISAIGVVNSDTITKSSGLTMTIKLLAYQDTGHWHQVNKQTLVRASIERSAGLQPCLGDTIMFKARVNPVLAGRMPLIGSQTFDYGAYLIRQGVYYQTRLGPNDFQIVNHGQQWYQIRVHLMTLRGWFQQSIADNMPIGNALGLVLGLALGLRQGIDTEMAGAFANTGTAHILSVSGMHTLVFFHVLTGLALVLGSRNKRHEVYWLVGSIILLWLYVVVAGMAPAALRAVSMTTVMILGKAIRRQTNMLNSLGLAVWVMLLLDAGQIMQAGFQLSVAGCVGLATFSQNWARLWRPNHWLTNLAWQSGVVTTAATLATFPISVYHFGQMPLWFLPANILVGGLSSLLTVLSIALALVGKIPIVGWLLGQVVMAVSTSVLMIVKVFNALPLSTMAIESGQFFQSALWISGLVAACQWWWYKQRWAAVYLAAFPLMILSLRLSQHYRQPQQGLWVWTQQGQVLTMASVGDSIYWLGMAPNEEVAAFWQRSLSNRPQRDVKTQTWATAWRQADHDILVVTGKPTYQSYTRTSAQGNMNIAQSDSKAKSRTPDFDLVIGQTSHLYGAHQLLANEQGSHVRGFRNDQTSSQHNSQSSSQATDPSSIQLDIKLSRQVKMRQWIVRYPKSYLGTDRQYVLTQSPCYAIADTDTL